MARASLRLGAEVLLDKPLLTFSVLSQQFRNACAELCKIGEHRRFPVFLVAQPRKLLVELLAQRPHLLVLRLQLVNHRRAARQVIAQEQEQPMFFPFEMWKELCLKKLRRAPQQLQGPFKVSALRIRNGALKRLQDTELLVD
jgi:hypothetical protein